MEAFIVPFSGHTVLVLEEEEVQQLRERLICDFFASDCIARKIERALTDEIVDVTS